MKKTQKRSATHVDKELGGKIRIRRTEIKMSQAELGAKLNVSFQQIQKYEKGINRVSVNRLTQIAEALGVPVMFFYGDKSKAEGEVETLLALDAHFSLRLLRAYATVKSRNVQRRFVDLMETIAQEA